MSELNRLRWKCRRGLLELDIVLGIFVEKYCASLSAVQLQAFDELLDFADDDLWVAISHPRQNHAAHLEPILSLLQQC